MDLTASTVGEGEGESIKTTTNTASIKIFSRDGAWLWFRYQTCIYKNISGFWSVYLVSLANKRDTNSVFLHICSETRSFHIFVLTIRYLETLAKQLRHRRTTGRVSPHAKLLHSVNFSLLGLPCGKGFRACFLCLGLPAYFTQNWVKLTVFPGLDPSWTLYSPTIYPRARWVC